MTEIRFHGRGGQGIVVASRILALAAFKEGKDVQSFPFFGVERRGAPVTAFTRIDHKQIRIRSQIYQPDCVVIFDPALVKIVNVGQGLKKDGIVLINSRRDPSQFKFDLPNNELFTIDADAVALEYGLGSSMLPMVNTAVLGAFAGINKEVKITSIVNSIREYVSIKLEGNIKAARKAYSLIRNR